MFSNESLESVEGGMTEQQWLRNDNPQGMLDSLRHKTSERKLRLFGQACRLSLWHFLGQNDTGRKVVEDAEPFAGWMIARSPLPRWLLAALVRDVFGNPFRPDTFDPAGLTGSAGAAVELAQVLYDECAFDRLPILADALEEAGCTDGELLLHLRGPGPHVRGCWALDAVLQKK
jgi:hypothetical protein